MERAIEKTWHQICAMPKPPSDNPVQEVSSLLSEFTRDVSTHVEGVSDEDGIIQRVRLAQEQFKLAIRRTAPAFRPFSETQVSSCAWRHPSFLSSEESVADAPESDLIYVEDVHARALQ